MWPCLRPKAAGTKLDTTPRSKISEIVLIQNGLPARHFHCGIAVAVARRVGNGRTLGRLDLSWRIDRYFWRPLSRIAQYHPAPWGRHLRHSIALRTAARDPDVSLLRAPVRRDSSRTVRGRDYRPVDRERRLRHRNRARWHSIDRSRADAGCSLARYVLHAGNAPHHLAASAT